MIAAVWATGFVRMLYFFEDRFEEFKIPPWSKALRGFGLVGVIGIWVPQVFGVGYVSIQQVLDQHVGIVRALGSLAKPLATSLTLGSGGSGGIFAPSFFTGAFLGDAFGRVVHPGISSVDRSRRRVWFSRYGRAVCCGRRGADDRDSDRLRDVERLHDHPAADGLLVIATVLGRR